MSPSKNHSDRVHAFQLRYVELKQKMQDVGFVCVASLQTPYLSCGTASCRCHQDPARRHGLYHYWTREVQGRTIVVLPKPNEVVLYREWIENNRQLETVVREMRPLSARALSLNTARPRSQRRSSSAERSGAA